MSNPYKKRTVIRGEDRAIVAKVFYFLKEEYNFMQANNFDNYDLSPLANVRRRTAEATGVSERTVSTILKEQRDMRLARLADENMMTERQSFNGNGSPSTSNST